MFYAIRIARSIMKFIGRKNELSKLPAEYGRNDDFVVVYGRCRIRKTTLIKEFLKGKVNGSGEIHKAFPGYEIFYGIFSKSGFSHRLVDIARENNTLILIQEDEIL